MNLILDGLNLITHSVFEWRSPLWNWLHEFGVQETRYGKERQICKTQVVEATNLILSHKKVHSMRREDGLRTQCWAILTGKGAQKRKSAGRLEKAQPDRSQENQDWCQQSQGQNSEKNCSLRVKEPAVSPNVSTPLFLSNKISVGPNKTYIYWPPLQ